MPVSDPTPPPLPGMPGWQPPEEKPWKPALLGFALAIGLVVGGLLLAAFAVSVVVSAFGNFKLFPNK